MGPYAELHAHSCWSLREGASSTDELVDRAVALGYPALAVTDHDNLYGAMEFAKAARERGIKPITGVELTVDGPTTGTTAHLTVLAETVEGYRNLCRLLSRAYIQHGKDTPLTPRDELFAHRAGLIVLSGCRQGPLAQLLESGDRRGALALAAEYRDALGADHFYVELQHHDVYGDSARVAALAEVAEAAGLEAVATNNAHYHVRARHRLNDVLVAVRHRLTLDSSHQVRRPNSEYFLKHPLDLAPRFERYPRALSNTVAIAERCTFDLTADLPYRLPDHDVPDGATLDSHLRGICERAFRRRYDTQDATTRTEARSRLERELGLIEKHGLAGFFLVYWEVLKMAGEIAHILHGRERDLPPDVRPVGRGRGSSVSSIVCYLIGLSHIDPVKNNLYLERFLNEELHSLPDIDLDFPRDIRDELLRQVYERFGHEHAALVAAFPTYRFKNAVLDIGKALGLPVPVLAKLNKLGGHFSGATEIAQEMQHIPELRPLVGTPIWQDLVQLAREAAGFPRHISQHVGGVVISADPISTVVPIEPARMEGRYICQWDKDSIDDARFVKIDFLALGMLSAVDDCQDIIEEVHGIRVDLGRIPHDSPEIFASIQAGDTMGTFQIESRAQIQSLPFTRPSTIDDLAVQVAIIRPGPIMAGAFHPYMEYRKRLARGEPIEVDYGHPELAPLLAGCLGETLGHVLYQDQVLQISCAVAGFTPGQADRLRRAMSRKRSTEAMQALADEFYAGAARMGVSREAAEIAFDKMAAFAAFGFPKSHAVAFALLAYESCWLRYHYPVAYYCALFNAQPMGFYSVEVLTGDARRHGIEVLAPAINASRAYAWPELDAIRLGLDQVKGMGGGWRTRGRGLTTAERIVRAREEGGAFRSLYDLVTRARLQRDDAEALIRAGTLDEFGLPRRELLWQLGLLVQGESRVEGRRRRQSDEVDLQNANNARVAEIENRKSKIAFQPALPLPTHQDMAGLPQLSPWQELAWDFELLGTTGKAHPMALVRPLLNEGVISSRQLGGPGNANRLPDGATIEIAGMVVTRQKPQTASGVMFMLLEDEFGLSNIVVYPKLADAQRELVRGTAFVVIRGRVDNDKSGFPNVIAERLWRCPLPGLIQAPEGHNFG
ncbi:MAG: DNA polymerase III subunit alpha [Dehalococcoidia bacterium]|nr:DNA polymerase III subunit alpha [Dehalococcoidia bacterium]